MHHYAFADHVHALPVDHTLVWDGSLQLGVDVGPVLETLLEIHPVCDCGADFVTFDNGQYAHVDGGGIRRWSHRRDHPARHD